MPDYNLTRYGITTDITRIIDHHYPDVERINDLLDIETTIFDMYHGYTYFKFIIHNDTLIPEDFINIIDYCQSIINQNTIGLYSSIIPVIDSGWGLRLTIFIKNTDNVINIINDWYCNLLNYIIDLSKIDNKWINSFSIERLDTVVTNHVYTTISRDIENVILYRNVVRDDMILDAIDYALYRLYTDYSGFDSDQYRQYNFPAIIPSK